MPIQWNPNLYKIGIKLIDEQHNTLFSALEKLQNSFGKENEKEISTEIINFLLDYVQKHFKDEEEIMTSISFPNLDFHMEQHLNFIENCKEFRSMFDTEGPNKKLLLQIYNTVFKWLVEHISISDKEISKYIKN